MGNNEDENIEDLDQENTASMEIMDINSADEDDCGGIVTVKEEYLEVCITFFYCYVFIKFVI